LAAWSALEGEFKEAGYHLIFMVPFTKWLKVVGKGAKIAKPALKRLIQKSPKLKKSLQYVKDNKDTLVRAGNKLVLNIEKQLEKDAQKDKKDRIKNDIKELIDALTNFDELFDSVEEIEKDDAPESPNQNALQQTV
jgi:molecular chaperone GrpE (heat shock protein)